ncbi:MAG: tRNA 5-methoxyuridine(34)/uridine 5-oxyacetic acid(34) synthase CmoB [Bdellovibrionota bacterium]
MTVTWPRPDILAEYADGIKLSEIDHVRTPRLAALERPHWAGARDLLAKLPTGDELDRRGQRPQLNFCSDVVQIGADGDLTPQEHAVLDELITKLLPWRKGPFSLFGHQIDSEWQSNRKWSRIEPFLDDLTGKRVLDVGCSNGYYMFRMLGHQQGAPECLVGIDPSESFYHAFELFQRFVRHPRISYQLLGIEHAALFPKFFDTVFCLGILYHQRDPLRALEWIREAMKPGGQLILESQAIPGDQSCALFAPDRYAKAHNVFFVPTAECLRSWAVRAGFQDAEVVSYETVTVAEQRRTPLAPYESLADFLDPDDPTRTVEGFPAPARAIVVARA